MHVHIQDGCGLNANCARSAKDEFSHVKVAYFKYKMINNNIA